MKNQNFDLSQAYVVDSNLISRHNQNNTVIIMQPDNANVFYKIDGLAAHLWNVMADPVQAQTLLNALAAKFPNADAAGFQTSLSAFMSRLVEMNLIRASASVPGPDRKEAAAAALSTAVATDFGGIKEFDLAQIESEVLNESIYLDVFAGSDMRLKKDVASLKKPLEKILALDGITYLWNEKTAHASAPSTTQTGLVAQQVAEIMPDLVKRDAATGMLTVNYTKITPYLVESIKELKSLIDGQSARITQLEAELKKTRH